MRYKIADLITEVPAAGGMASRCKDYLTSQNTEPDIVIHADLYDAEKWKPLAEDRAIYMESGFQFYRQLLRFNGIMLHASAIEMDGWAYLFSGPSGVGKSTHTALWLDAFGQKASVINDDKPAIRFVDSYWFVYGTPWSGKNGINRNSKARLAGICFLKQGTSNRITQLTAKKAVPYFISQTTHKKLSAENMEQMLNCVEKLVKEIPFYELECLPNIEAVQLSYETMRRGAEEIGL